MVVSKLKHLLIDGISQFNSHAGHQDILIGQILTFKPAFHVLPVKTRIELIRQV